MLLNAQGNPVATKPITVQLDMPCEQAASEAGTINWFAVITAVVQLTMALKAGDPVGIANALQALIKAITGQ